MPLRTDSCLTRLDQNQSFQPGKVEVVRHVVAVKDDAVVAVGDVVAGTAEDVNTGQPSTEGHILEVVAC